MQHYSDNKTGAPFGDIYKETYFEYLQIYSYFPNIRGIY